MAKKSKDKSKTKPKPSYLQDWGTYSNQTFVCVGMSFDEMVDELKKLGVSKEAINEFLDGREVTTKTLESGPNGMAQCIEGRSLLWFRDWKNDWQHWDCLVHEISHLIDMVMHSNKKMCEETEAKAYQFEYLFKNIRRKLWGMTDPKHPDYKKPKK